MFYKVVCNKEKEFLEQGCTLEQIYCEFGPYRMLTKQEAEEAADQLNEFAVDEEVYHIEEVKC